MAKSLYLYINEDPRSLILINNSKLITSNELQFQRELVHRRFP